MKTGEDTFLLDEGLISQYKQGDVNSLGVLYSRYYNKVFNKCLSFAKNYDDAFDLTQEVILKAFHKIDTFKGESKFSTWLYALVHNYCIESYRKKQKIQQENIEDCYHLAEYFFDAEESDAFENKSSSVKEILANMPNMDKMMLLMKYEQNKSIKDLQIIFNLSASAVKMRLQRARHKIEKIYNENQQLAEAV